MAPASAWVALNIGRDLTLSDSKLTEETLPVRLTFF